MSDIQKPIIAIVSSPFPEDDDTSDINFVGQNYNNWLRELGAEVVVLYWKSSLKDIQTILSEVNGVLIQGGNRKLRKTGSYEQQATIIINESIKNKIPIWLTCLGIQILHCYLADDYSILSNFNAKLCLLPTKYNEKEIINSKILSKFTVEDLKLSETTKCYPHNNGLGVEEKLYLKYKALSDNLKIISKSKDNNGKEFISIVESKDFTKNKFFSTQCHPEKARYSFREEDHNVYSFKISHIIGLGYIEEAKNSRQSEQFESLFCHKFVLKPDDYSVKMGFNMMSYFKQTELLSFGEVEKIVDGVEYCEFTQ